MSYAGIQTRVLTLLQLLSEFDADNSSEYDYRTLKDGAAQYAILMRGNSGTGDSGQVDVADGKKRYVRRDDWGVNIELYAAFTVSGADTRSRLNTLVDTVTEHFDKYQDLNGLDGVIDVHLNLVGEPDEWTVGNGRYWRQILEMNVIEYSEVFMAEDHSGLIPRWDGNSVWDGTAAWR